MSDSFSEREREQRRKAGQASAEARRRNRQAKPEGEQRERKPRQPRPQPSYADRLERHQRRQREDPRYSAQTADVIPTRRLEVGLGAAGAALGAAGGLGIGFMAAPPKGEFFPLYAGHNTSLLTRTIRGAMTGAGSLGGRALGRIGAEGADLGRRMVNRGFNRNFNPVNLQRWGDVGSRLGAASGRTGYNIYATGKSLLTNLIHAGTGRSRFLTGAILGAPMAAYAAPTLYAGGSALGRHLDPMFPHRVQKRVTMHRLQKALDYAVTIEIIKGRPAGRPLSEEEREQRREAARASAEARRRNAAERAGVDVSNVNSRGDIRQRAYTPRARDEHGNFRQYSDDEAMRLERVRAEARYLRQQRNAEDIRFDSERGQLKTGDGRYRRSSGTRVDRALDRTVGEAMFPGAGRHAAKVVSAVRESFSVRDPEAKYGTIGAGLGLATGGLLATNENQKSVGRAAKYVTNRVAMPMVSYVRAGLQRTGLLHKPPSTIDNAKATIRAARIGTWLPRRLGAGALKGFGSAAFLAPVVGGIGWAIGSSIGRGVKERDRAALIRDLDYKQRLARLEVTNRG